MNILIFGASGFIGKDFTDRYVERFENVFIFSRLGKCINTDSRLKLVEFGDLESLPEIDCILHLAFDHSYRENLKLAELVYSICKLNSCPLIYLSSFVVRDLLTSGSIKGTKSRLYDPYTLEKLRVKNHLETLFDRSGINLLQIEPGIVFGKRGGWFEHVREALSYDNISLVRAGENKSAFIYVGDLSAYLFDQINKDNISNDSVLIAGDVVKSWRDFYSLYGKILGRKFSIVKNNSRRLHSNFIINILMKLIIFSKVGAVFFKITPILKYYFKKASRPRISEKKFLTKTNLESYKSYGLTMLLQSSDLEKNITEKYNDFTKINNLTKNQMLEEMKNG